MPARRGAAGLALVAAAYAAVWLVAVAGPSVAVHPLPGGGLPLTLHRTPAPVPVTALLVGATIVGSVGIGLAWSAVRRGWAPRPARLLAGGLVVVAAFGLVPPVTSDDVFSYAAYGRLARLGHDPYTTAPAAVRDPVTDAVTPPWRATPSVYGPLATAEQVLVMRVAGRSVRVGVWLLALVGAAATAATALLLDRLAADAAGRRRAALLFALNPVVVLPLVAGAHVDALLVLPVVAAVGVVRRRPALAGLLAGAAVSVKLTGALAVAGLAWWLRASPRRLAGFAAAVAAVAVPAYLAVGGPTAVEQARRASRFVSFAVPWRWLADALDGRTPRSRTVVGVLALVVVVALVGLLARGLPTATGSGGPARVVLVPVLAWLLGTTYLLPWYDATAWALLALLPWSAWDGLLLVRTTTLVVAYLPGREVPAGLGRSLRWVRRVAARTVVTATVVAAVILAARGRYGEGFRRNRTV